MKVLLRAVSGPTAHLVYEAESAQKVDDDVSGLYCGLLYVYDDHTVYLHAPNVNRGSTDGRIFCSGDVLLL